MLNTLPDKINIANGVLRMPEAMIFYDQLVLMSPSSANIHKGRMLA
jgi:hypothetical protein